MKFLIPTFLLFFAISWVSCQKDGEEISTEEENLALDPINRDSISFTLNEKNYSSKEMDGFGFANKQTNIKPYADRMSARVPAYITGGHWWYGEKDSLLFEQTFSFKSPEFTNITIGVSQKYASADLIKKDNLLVPYKNDTTFLVGPKDFATDNNLENKTHGVSLELTPILTTERLTTSIPALSILVRSQLDNHLQDDSYFHIINIDTLANDALRVEARFEANVYAEDGTAYRIKDGFVRFKTKLKQLDVK
ncbi:MAG: hypothetical protein LBE37_05980 [Sphingobacterium sp.]|jgi:hypothetical protein|nr:hypothetical protein [Sphingobacterium sp.]